MSAQSVPIAFPFDDSRRLTGANLYFDGPGAVLEVVATVALDAAAQARWRQRIAQARAALGWSEAASAIVRNHENGATLAIEALVDGLFTATEVNEWALCAALGLRLGSESMDGDSQPPRPHPAHFDGSEALRQLAESARAEAARNAPLLALLTAANARSVPAHADEELLSLGEGTCSQQWPLAALPAPADVPWETLRRVPKALVTGSNGKTTTVRLLAALLADGGRCVGYSSTDGVVVTGKSLEGGDYSGPAGARAVLRGSGVQAAVLETARGGLLRRGLAVDDADTAIVTNVSVDHFGEYGIDDLDALAEVKLVVAKALLPKGLLVLNAGDSTLVARAAQLQDKHIGWFALNLEIAAAHGLPACGARARRLVLATDTAEFDLGAIADMPLTVGGAARYNIENSAAAALAAWTMGVAPDRIAGVLTRFGASNADNPGRLQRWQLGDAKVVLDYAHNPEGLQGLFELAAALPHQRMALLLGHAGNRRDEDYRAVADVVARAKPDRVWLKDIGGGYLRGRASGDVAHILREELHALGLALDALPVCLDEVQATREALAWAQSGDLLLLPVHEPGKRAAVVALLDRLQAEDWRPGSPFF